MEDSKYSEILQFLSTGQFPSSIDDYSGKKRKELRKSFKRSASNYSLSEDGEKLYRALPLTGTCMRV